MRVHLFVLFHTVVQLKMCSHRDNFITFVLVLLPQHDKPLSLPDRGLVQSELCGLEEKTDVEITVIRLTGNINL